MSASSEPPTAADRRRRRRRPRPSQQTFWVRRGLAALAVVLGLWLAVTVLGAIGGALFGGDDETTAQTAGGGASSSGGGSSGGGSAGSGDGSSGDDAPARPKPTFLPGGGRRILPDKRVVAFYGNPADDELGELGIGTPDQAAAKLKRLATSYARKTRPTLPCLELITSIAANAPGADGKYRNRVPGKVIDRYLKAARKAGAILVLDIQPGHATFPEEVRRLKKWLVQPDVGLALDPEWRLQAGQVPGQVIGSVGAAEVNRVSTDLAALVRERNLPQKLFVVHQFTDDMVRDKPQIVVHPELATVFNVDGFGDAPNKISKYKAFVPSTPRGAYPGFKLFFREDVNRMSPTRVMALKPRPAFVVYE